MNSDSKNESIQGKWFRINKNVKKRVTASYDKIKDWKLDPKGYFLIDIDKKKKLLKKIHFRKISGKLTVCFRVNKTLQSENLAFC